MFAGFVAHMEDTRLPKCVMFGESVGGADSVGGQEKEWVAGYFLDDLKVFGINADQWTIAILNEGNGAGRRNKGRNISWRNRSLQRKPGLDYGMQ